MLSRRFWSHADVGTISIISFRGGSGGRGSLFAIGFLAALLADVFFGSTFFAAVFFAGALLAVSMSNPVVALGTVWLVLGA